MDFITPIIKFIENNFKKPFLTFSVLYLLYKFLDKLFEFNIKIPYEDYIRATAFTFIALEILILLNKIIRGFFYYCRQRKKLSTTYNNIKSDMRLYLKAKSHKKDILKKIISCEHVEYSNTFPVNKNEEHNLSDPHYYVIDINLETDPSLINCIHKHLLPSRSRLFIGSVGSSSKEYWWFKHDCICINPLLLQVLREDILL